MLFDFQAAIDRWAIRRGRAAIFADCGLGKSLMQLVWAMQAGERVLIFAPLAEKPAAPEPRQRSIASVASLPPGRRNKRARKQ